MRVNEGQNNESCAGKVMDQTMTMDWYDGFIHWCEKIYYCCCRSSCCPWGLLHANRPQLHGNSQSRSMIWPGGWYSIQLFHCMVEQPMVCFLIWGSMQEKWWFWWRQWSCRVHWLHKSGGTKLVIVVSWPLKFLAYSPCLCGCIGGGWVVEALILGFPLYLVVTRTSDYKESISYNI